MPPQTTTTTTTTSPPTLDLPDLPTPPPWLLPTAILTLALAGVLVLFAYHLTMHGIGAERQSDDDEGHDFTSTKNARSPGGGLPFRGEANARRRRGHRRTKSRIQRIWEERSRAKAGARGREDGGEERVELLPRTPDAWGCDESGGSAVEMGAWRGGARRRGGYVGVPEEDEDSGYDGDGEVGGERKKGGGRGRSGFLGRVNAGIDLAVEMLAAYLDDDAGERGLVFPVTEEERGYVREDFD